MQSSVVRVLLDNCIPKRFARELSELTVAHALDLGWGQLTDGELLEAMSGRFDVLVTLDQSLPFQQRIDGRSFGVAVLRARTSRLIDLRPLIPELVEAVRQIAPGEVRTVRL